jgi:CubicO group peptidase (beta-lactamase class C family)
MTKYVFTRAPIVLLLLFPLAIALNFRPIQTKIDKDSIARLERDIPRLMTEADIPGLSVAVIRNGNIAWSHNFGVMNSETKKPVDDNTIFEAASLSKPVFAYAVFQLVDSGKLDLDKPLNQYLPGRYDVGDDPRLDQITARRVLSHTTGFPNWRPRGDPKVKIYFTPGDRFSYSGEGFVYLSRVIEHITGEQLDAFMKRTVFDPLGMKSSSYAWRDDYDSRKTYAHNSVGGVSGLNKVEKPNAAASLQTNAADYATFVCAILNGTGLKPESRTLMLSSQISVGETSNSINTPQPKLSPTISWGLGWGLEKTRDGAAFWHWGDNGDAKAYVVAYEKQKTGVVMFANASNGLAIIREFVEDTVGGEHPSLSWINYERYDSQARLLLKAILKSDAETVLAEYIRTRGPAKPEGVGPTTKTEGGRPKTKNAPTERLTEDQVNRLGYQLLGLKRVKDAITVFKQNTVDFPNGFNTWDSLAEGYMVSGDKEAAIKYYKKSLELNPENTNAVTQLKQLEK